LYNRRLSPIQSRLGSLSEADQAADSNIDFYRSSLDDEFVSVLPVIVRELKAQARQPFTYWLRVIGGVSVAIAFGVAFFAMERLNGLRLGWGPTVSTNPNPVETFGIALFGKLNYLIFLAIWIFVPLSIADAISRERREGTLPLLFLTELRSLGIVIAKALVHFLRAASLFLTMAPWLMIPLLFGGVGVRDIQAALTLDSAALLLALAAGLLASTISRDWVKSIILAEIFGLLTLLCMLNAYENLLHRAIRVGTPPPMMGGGAIPWQMVLAPRRGSEFGMILHTIVLIEFTTNGSVEGFGGYYAGLGRQQVIWTPWRGIWDNLTAAGQQAWLTGIAGMLWKAAVILLFAIILAAWRLGRSWQHAPASGRISDLKRKFFSPRFRTEALRRNLSRSLTANPIGWLQHYSVHARMVKWGWCLFILIVEILLSSNAEDLYFAQAALGLLLLLGLTFSSTGSFRNELETGAFELLLVTPIRERQIIIGRLRGLWRQFLPAIAIYGAGTIYLASGWAGEGRAHQAWLRLAEMMIAFSALPIIGLYFSMRRLNFFVALVGACLVGLLPAAVGRSSNLSLAENIALQLGVALLFWIMLEARLRKRAFLAGVVKAEKIVG
jgi:ABC-type transport system involved in multi-copper enzyme maturation permease subunit